ncbi:MAG: transposase [Endozoicomonas sp.]
MARFVVDVVEQLDLSEHVKPYRGSGSKPWHPDIMVSLLFYGYATGAARCSGTRRRCGSTGRMRWRIQAKEGQGLYSKRKYTIKPTFRIQKEALDYRRFMVRGLEVVSKEWELVCITFNLRRIFSL